MDDASAAPYAGLTPDCVLDALDAVGLFCDGRLLALNSYENRVYQAWLDERARPSAETAPSSVVVKFYRPSRWSDAADRRGARIRRRAGRARDPGRRADRERRRDPASFRRLPLCGLSAMRRPRSRARGSRDARMDRPFRRTHPRRRRDRAVSRAAVARRRELRRRAARVAARERLHPAPTWSPPGRASPRRRSNACGIATSARARSATFACTATAMPATCCGAAAADAGAAFRRFRRLPQRTRGAGPVDAAVGRPRRHAPPVAGRAVGLRGFLRLRRPRAAPDRSAAHAAADPLFGVAGAALERSRFPGGVSRGSTPSATGRIACWSCASRSRRWTSRRCRSSEQCVPPQRRRRHATRASGGSRPPTPSARRRPDARSDRCAPPDRDRA